MEVGGGDERNTEKGLKKKGGEEKGRSKRRDGD